MNAQLAKKVKKHRQYVAMGLDIRAALVTVSAEIKTLQALRETRTFSKTFQDAATAELQRLNLESSAMHVVIRELEAYAPPTK